MNQSKSLLQESSFCANRACTSRKIALPRTMAKPCRHWLPHSQLQSSKSNILNFTGIKTTQLVLKRTFHPCMAFCTARLRKWWPPTIIASPRIVDKPCSHWLPHSQTQTSASQLAMPRTQLVLKSETFHPRVVFCTATHIKGGS